VLLALVKELLQSRICVGQSQLLLPQFGDFGHHPLLLFHVPALQSLPVLFVFLLSLSLDRFQLLDVVIELFVFEAEGLQCLPIGLGHADLLLNDPTLLVEILVALRDPSDEA
jgi:hypothetical protein